MSEMIERVAKAMAKADADNTAWKLYVREARAAIEAMREPTASMEDAAFDREGIFVWRAMIDAALAKTPA